jgi:2,3-dihydroxyphenylpropionate 1,2-dioxygenase
MQSTILGGAMLPHAPQFFTLPDTEDKTTVARVQKTAAQIGEQLRALKPDLWIIFSNDHAEQFFHQVAPAFTIHVGGEASGEFAGRSFHWQVPGETGIELVRRLYRLGFDPAFTSTARIDYAIGIPLTHIGHRAAVLPVFVNAYLPPQPTMERCYAFGVAIAQSLTAMGLRTVVLASGGMSHFPGTGRYSQPDLEWDEKTLARLKGGNLKSLLGYDEVELDNTGNIELRCWACAAGALGQRKPDIVALDPSWHHNYASLAWYTPNGPANDIHYPSIRPELISLTTALHRIAHERDQRDAFIEDRAAFAALFSLDAIQEDLLLRMDVPAMVELGVHPLIPFLANMQIERTQRAGHSS